MLLSTRSLTGYGLDTIFFLAKKAGYSGIDLSIHYDLYDTTNDQYLDILMKRHDLRIESITAPERKITKKRVETLLHLADNLGIHIVNFHPPHRTDKDKDWFGDFLKSMMIKYPSLIINIVNAPPKTWLFIISEYGDARPETIKKITEHTALSIAHVEPESGVDLMKTFTLLGNTISLTYLSDKTEEKPGLFPGDGVMPLESLLIRMRESGYNGQFTLDIDPHSLGAGDDDLVLENLIKAKKFLEKYF